MYIFNDLLWSKGLYNFSLTHSLPQNILIKAVLSLDINIKGYNRCDDDIGAVLNLSKSSWLPKYATVPTRKLIAILMSLFLFWNFCLFRSPVVFSNSLICHLAKRSKNVNHEIILCVPNTLSRGGTICAFCVMPSYTSCLVMEQHSTAMMRWR